MRPLIGMLAIAATLGASTAESASHEAYSRLSSTSGTGTPASEALGASPGVARRAAAIGFRVAGVGSGLLTLGAGAGVESLETDIVDVRDRHGEKRPISESASTAATGEVEATLSRGSTSLALSGAATTDESPFATRRVAAVLRRSLRERATAVILTQTYFEQEQPPSFFVDRDYRTKARPAMVHAVQSSLGFEQAVTDRWKVGIDVATGVRREERPRNVGVGITSLHALTPRLFGRLEGRHVREQRNEPLKNERGYFELSSLKAELTVEPLFDWLMSASYGAQREREEDPRVSYEGELTSRVYGLGTRIDHARGLYEWRVQMTEDEHRATRLALEGGVTWRL